MTNARQPIRPLSSDLINQIAAGEVIERPASLVKELIENSLDAGASKIDVEIDDGGIKRVLVRDDGHGIPMGELELALARHCTSKLNASADLDAIVSLGFRGEALASICAVAQVSLSTRAAGAALGYRLERGPLRDSESCAPCPHPVGTTVEATGLFANTPARRRFLKRPQTEALHIQQLIRRFGFCCPQVTFTLLQDGRRSLIFPAVTDTRTRDRRWRSLFGADFAAHAHEVEFTGEDIDIHGWVGGPDLSSNSVEQQFLAVNGRIIKDRALSHAIRLVFDNQLPVGKYPAYALHLNVPAHTVDVNVHPGKSEVRFHRLREVHDAVFTATRRALTAPALGAAAATVAVFDLHVSSPLQVAEPGPGHFRSTLRAHARHSTHEPPLQQHDWTVVAIVASRYAVVVDDATTALVDLQELVAATVDRRLGAELSQGEVRSRPVLFPHAINLNAQVLDETRLQALQRLGFDISMLGPESALLRAVPVVLPELDLTRFAEEFVPLITQDATSEVAAVALAAGRALLPQSRAGMGTWWETLSATAQAAGVDMRDFMRVLDAAVLDRVMRQSL